MRGLSGEWAVDWKFVESEKELKSKVAALKRARPLSAPLCNSR